MITIKGVIFLVACASLISVLWKLTPIEKKDEDESQTEGYQDS